LKRVSAGGRTVDVTFVLFVLPGLIIAMALLGFYATKERDRSDPEVRR
jgi:hypothetical protein